jgi:hypothetical protein
MVDSRVGGVVKGRFGTNTEYGHQSKKVLGLGDGPFLGDPVSRYPFSDEYRHLRISRKEQRLKKLADNQQKYYK